jgi:hypothetical protein
MTKYVAFLAVFALGVVVAGFATAAPQKDSYKLTANLKSRFEVPKPTSVRTGATGLFNGTAVEMANDKARLAWRLTFSKLSGRAAAAHIHKGRAGKAGPVLVALCGPCRNGQRGATTITHAQLRGIRTGVTYVNIHTPKNAAGEIRGQIKVAASSDDSGSSTTTETTTTTTTITYPYP